MKSIKYSIAVIFIIITAGYIMFRWYTNSYLPTQYKNDLEFVVQKVMSSMSRAQLAGQVLHINIPGSRFDTDAEKELDDIQPGGIILFGRNLGTHDDVKNMNMALQNKVLELRIPGLFISTDQEGGYVYRLRDGIPQFPSAAGFGQMRNASLSEQAGYYVGEALLSAGINVAFAPILDINNNPGNPVIGVRSFGSDTETVIESALPYEKGLRASGAMSVIKHFPGHGDTLIDSHLGLPKIFKTEAQISQFELIPFQKAIQNGANAVMTAHIIYEKIDPDFPATLSHKILTGILRDRLQFNGLIFTDAMEMHAISKNFARDKPAVKALLAGADVILMTSWGENARRMLNEIKNADKDGYFLQKDSQGKKIDILEERVKNQLRHKIEYGLVNLATETDKHERMNAFIKKKKEIPGTFRANIEKNRSMILALINRESIRAWPAPFIPLPKREISRIKWMGVQPTVSRVINDFQQEVSLQESNIFSPDVAVFYANSPAGFSPAYNYARKNTKKKVIVLYSGKPYVKFKTAPNLNYLLSFSPEASAIKALTQALLSDDISPAPIPTMRLALP